MWPNLSITSKRKTLLIGVLIIFQLLSAPLTFRNLVWPRTTGGIVVTTKFSKDDAHADTNMMTRTMYPPVSNDSLVAVCAIQKDAEAYLDEWVQYQLALGVSDVFLYDNSDKFDLKGWADSIKSTLPQVHVKHFPGTKLQRAAYKDCVDVLRRGGRTFKWVGLLDSDEFLVLKNHSTVSELLEQHCPDDCGSLVVNWFVYGPNNHTAYLPLPVLKRFTFREDGINHHVKSFARVEMFKGTRTPHCAITNRAVYDTNGRALNESCPFNPGGPIDVAVIHHMWSKSCKEYASRCARGRADHGPDPSRIPACKDPCPANDRFTVFDDSAWSFLKERVPAFAAYDELAPVYGYG